MSGRIRSVKPELLEDERVAQLSHAAFRLFVGSILLADDHGNLRWVTRWLQGQVFWGHAEMTADEVEEAQRELIGSDPGKGLLAAYEVNDQWYAHVVGWEKHQKVDHPGKPRVPTPDDANGFESFPCFRETLGDDSTTLAPDLRSLRRISEKDHRPPNVVDVVQPEDHEKPDPKPATPLLLSLPEPKAPPAEDQVLEHWAGQGYHGRRPKLTSDRRKRVVARMREGFTVEDLKLAVEGAELDDWLMGRKQGSPGYRDIETLLRDAAQVERLRDLGTTLRQRRAAKAERSEATDLDRLMATMPPWAPDPRKSELPSPEDLAAFKARARRALEARSKAWSMSA